jgi:hypothetical protein
MFHVPVRNKDRQAICPVCEVPVDRVGTMCSRTCYAHFLVAVTSQAGIIEMEEFVDMEQQPWYGEGSEA